MSAPSHRSTRSIRLAGILGSVLTFAVLLPLVAAGLAGATPTASAAPADAISRQLALRMPQVAVAQRSGAPAAVAAPRKLGAIITVNTTDQEVNSDADCSLQEAIAAANFDAALAINPNSLNGPKITTGCTPGSGDDTIVLAPNAVYPTNGTVASGVQFGVAQDQFNPVGLTATPSVTSTMTIEGNGARFERIAGTVGLVRAFMVNQQVGVEVSHADGNLTIRNLHIKGFQAQGGPGSDGGGGGLGAGGAIYNRGGTLTIENSTFEGNSATGGAGAAVSSIAGGGGGGGMSSSSIGGNDTAVGAGNGGGGGGGARGRGGNGPDSGGGGGGTALNGVDGIGGGVGGNGGFNCGGKGGDFPNNSGNAGFCSGGAGGGGAQGTGAGVNGGNGGAGNYGGGGGGGGASSQAQGGNGGAGGFGGGGGAGATGTSNGGAGGFGAGGGARGSTGGTPGTGGFFGIGGTGGLNGGGGGSGLGGAIFNDSGTVTVHNSTFFTNTAVSGPRGSTAGNGGTSGVGLGGAIWSRNGTLNVVHATFNQNRVTPAPGTAESEGAIGLWTDSGQSATINLRNSILFGNGSSECTAFQPGGGGAITKNGSGNLIGSNSGGTGACPGVVTTVDPQLGPLQINPPGNTPTMAIDENSSAFDAGDNAESLPTDQRGVSRPQGGIVDIGAFEVIVADVSLSKACYARAPGFEGVPPGGGGGGQPGGRQQPDGGPQQVDADVVIAGTQWICTLTIFNPNFVDLVDITITDTVPAGLTYVASTVNADAQITGTVAACAPQPLVGPGELTCAGIDVGAFDSTSFQLAFIVNPGYVSLTPFGEAPVTNTACITDVGGGGFDPDPSDNCASDTDLVKELADLKITKFVEPTQHVRAGEIFTYTIYVDNYGPSFARRVVISDTLLSSARVSIQSCAFSVSQGGGAITQFTCTTGNLVSTQFGTDIGTFSTNFLENLSPTSQGRLRASFRLVALNEMDVTNTVRVTSATPDPDTTNNFATVNIDVTAVADLQAFSVFGAEVQTPGQPGNIFNSNVITPMPDPACCNFGGTTVTAGRRIQWDTTVLNAGPSRAENVNIHVFLPYGTQLVENTLTGLPPGNPNAKPGRCRTEPAGEIRKEVVCEYGTLLLGQQGSLRFIVVVDPTLPPGTQLSFDSIAFSDNFEEATPVMQRHTLTVAEPVPGIDEPGTFDPDLSNNITSIQFDVNAFADLAITKSAVGDVVTGYNQTLGQFTKAQLPNQVTAGELLEYTLVVTHKGPSLARNVHIRDDLPGPAGPIAQVTFVSASTVSGPPVTCVVSGVNRDIVDCELGDMMPGDVRTVRILVRVDPSVPAGTLLVNTAVVSSSTPDPFLADNTATNTTAVNAVADLFIRKEDLPARADLDRPGEPDLALAGNEHRYAITFGNNGPSTAVNVNVTDLLDFKQAGILGETFLRCEPLDPDDRVTCTFTAPNTVTLSFLQVGNEPIFPAAGTGTLVPGRTFGFILVTRVDSGYVLDADNTGTLATGAVAKGFLAVNTANISSTTTDFRTQNNTDRHLTLIVAEADLALTKTDIFGTNFLECDPVAPGGQVRYTIVVTNNGPSDAAEVFVVDQLPAGLVLDPALVTITVSEGTVVDLNGAAPGQARDDGRIEVIVGNDPNNLGVAQIGRLNAPGTPGAGPVTITIVARVGLNAPCGSLLSNTATVTTRANNTLWPPAGQPFPGFDGGPRTPTPDPILINNAATETTRIECPSIRVVKTVSFNGRCPGQALTVINQTGQPVTFCFEVTNTGTTFLDNIVLVDIMRTRTQGDIQLPITCSPIRSGPNDPNVPLAPGETVVCSVTVDQLLSVCECGLNTNTVTVTATPVNSGRTVFPCLPVVTDSDTRDIEVPCAGVDWRIQLPILDTQNCQTWIQVQNVGDADTKALLVFWGEAGACPPQAAGPLKVECSGLLKPGSAWSFALTGSQLPVGAKSAVAYSLNAENLVRDDQGNLDLPFADYACGALFRYIVGDHEQWWRFDLAYRLRGVYRSPFDVSGLHQVVLDFGANRGEPLAVTVNRKCPDPVDPNVVGNAAYGGISSDMEGARDPVSGSFTSYAPLIFAQRAGLNSTICIQNSGIECTSLEIWFKAQDNCLRAILGDVLTLAPGETICFDPNTVVGPDWLGSAWIRSTQPLGIVVDTVGANHFTSYTGVPADVNALAFTFGDQVTFAPLVYNQMQGWDTAIQVQNHSAVTAAKVKVYFLDQSGGILETIVDWICPRGSQSFFLPVIGGLPGNWVGSARVESQIWWTPGAPAVDAPFVSAVVMLEKWSDPARTSRREAVAYNAQSECLLFDWQIGSGTGGTQSGSAVFAVPLLMKDYNGITTELAITNLVPKPGFTDFAIFIYDQNGLLDYICQKLNEKQVEYINLATWGYVNPRFNGSAVVSAVFWEHDVFDGEGGFTRNLVGLGGVAVERVGGILNGPDVPGDESKAFEAFPVFNHFRPQIVPNCPGVGRTQP